MTAMVVDVFTMLLESLEQLGPEAAARLRGLNRAPWERPPVGFTALEQALGTVDYALVLGRECQRTGAAIPMEQVAAQVARLPHKCLGLAGIDPAAGDPVPMVEAGRRLGLAGAVISPAAQGIAPTDARCMALYARCQEIGWPIVVVPGAEDSPRAILEYAEPVLFDSVLRDFPLLRVLWAGSGAPWAAQVLTLLLRHRHAHATCPDLLDRPWERYQFLLAASEQGVLDRLLLGSGYPLLTPDEAVRRLLAVNDILAGTRLPRLPREGLQAIVHRDALGCLGLRAPPPQAPGLAGEVAESDDADLKRSVNKPRGPARAGA